MEPKLFHAAELAAKRRDTATAYKLMRQVILENPTFVPAWLAMSKLVNDPAQQRECLARALALDPENKVARERTEELRVKELLSTISLFGASPELPITRKLGEFLVEEQIITEIQLQEALAEQARRKRQGRPILLGELLLQTGLLTPERLAHALVNQTLAWVPANERGIHSDAYVVQRLGDYLVAEKIITPAQLECALIEQIRLRQQGEQVLLGQILLRNQCLTIEILENLLNRQRAEFFSKFGD